MTNATESPKTKLSVDVALKDLGAAAHELPINESTSQGNTQNLTAAKLLLFGVCAAIDQNSNLDCGEPIVRDLERALALMSSAHDHFLESMLSEGMMVRHSRERFRELCAALESLQMANSRVEGIKDAITGSDYDEIPF